MMLSCEFHADYTEHTDDTLALIADHKSKAVGDDIRPGVRVMRRRATGR